MRVAFRVDASRAIGTGHVMRCLALADAIADAGGACSFVMRRLDGNLVDLVASKGHAVLTLPASAKGRPPAGAGDGHLAWLEADPVVDAEETFAALDSSGPWKWLVVDHYALEAAWERAVRNAAEKLAVIDDLADRTHVADLLLDQNLSDDPKRYDDLVGDRCEKLLGPRYALLRPEFAALAAEAARDPRAPVRTVLVFFGGVDAAGATRPALDVLESIRHEGLTCDVVVGPTNPRAGEIAAWAAAREWVRLHRGDVDLAALMTESDLAIGAGGTTMWERCALGLPQIVLTIADNQLPGVSAAARRGAVLYAGRAPGDEWVENLRDLMAIVIASPELRAELSKQAGELVDGRGTERVMARICGTPSLRPAQRSDAEAMLEWRNDPATRRYMRNPELIGRDDHFAWFQARLADTACDLLIGELADEPIGVIRFDHAADEAEVSLYLVPGHAGRGHGRRLLRAGIEWIEASRPATRALKAESLPGNEASRRAFLAAGFASDGQIYRYRIGEEKQP